MNFEALSSLSLEFLGQWQEAGSRLFIWNILASILLLFFWAMIQFGSKRGVSKSLRLLFNRKYWWNRSTKRDYLLFVSNFFIKGLLLIPLLDFSFHISRFLSNAMVQLTGDFLSLEPTAFAIVSFTLFSFVWDDGLRFVQIGRAHV